MLTNYLAICKYFSMTIQTIKVFVDNNDLQDIFKDAAHNEAFGKWLDFLASKQIIMNHDFIENIRAAQNKPMDGPPGSGRGFSYTEYFGRAAWDKNMPPIEKIQIVEHDFVTEKPVRQHNSFPKRGPF